jgi:hypothetical protein
MIKKQTSDLSVCDAPYLHATAQACRHLKYRIIAPVITLKKCIDDQKLNSHSIALMGHYGTKIAHIDEMWMGKRMYSKGGFT